MRRIITRLYIIHIFIVLLVSMPVHSEIVFDNGPPNGDSGDELTWWIEAEDFMVPIDTTVTGVHFWAVEQYYAGNGIPWNGVLEYYIYNSAGSKPDTLITQGNGKHVNRTFTSDISFGKEYEYEFEFEKPLEIEANKVYWLGLHLSDNFDTLYRIYWRSTTSEDAFGATGVASYGGYEDWEDQTNNQHAFYLVPEPTTLSLFTFGAILARRRGKI